MKTRNLLGSIAAVLLVLGTTACSSSGVPEAPTTFKEVQAQARTDGGKQQVKILSDGTVSTTEFQQALNSYFSCLDRSGLTHSYNGANPVDGWRPLTDVFWKGLGDDVGQSRMRSCQQKNLRYVTFGYQLVHTDVMDPALMTSVQKCLSARGIHVKGTERNVEDLLPLRGKDKARASAVQSCVFSASASYPNGVIFTY